MCSQSMAGFKVTYHKFSIKRYFLTPVCLRTLESRVLGLAHAAHIHSSFKSVLALVAESHPSLPAVLFHRAISAA